MFLEDSVITALHFAQEYITVGALLGEGGVVGKIRKNVRGRPGQES
jgi:hypothetical protein